MLALGARLPVLGLVIFIITIAFFGVVLLIVLTEDLQSAIPDLNFDNWFSAEINYGNSNSNLNLGVSRSALGVRLSDTFRIPLSSISQVTSVSAGFHQHNVNPPVKPTSLAGLNRSSEVYISLFTNRTQDGMSPEIMGMSK